MTEQFHDGPFYIYKNTAMITTDKSLPVEFKTYSEAMFVINALCFGGDMNPFSGSIESIGLDNKFYFNNICYVIRRKEDAVKEFQTLTTRN